MQVASPTSMETPAKSSGNKGLGLMKKLKGFDGLAVSTGCGNAENAAGNEAHGVSQRWIQQLRFLNGVSCFKLSDSSSALMP